MKYASVGSGEGVRRFIGKNIADEERVDFGASDSAMSDAEIAQTSSDTLMVPITAGCIALAYNLPGFHGDLKISRRAYAGIFLGEVKSWTVDALNDLDLSYSIRDRVAIRDISRTSLLWARKTVTLP